MRVERSFGLSSVVLLLGIVQCFPQGQITFNNRVNNVVVAPVYGLESADAHVAKHGNTASGSPAGSQTYSGALLAGTGFSAQLFAGPTNAMEADLKALEDTVTFRTGDGAGFVVAPSFALRVTDVPEGERAQVRLRVWNNRSGTITNWTEVLADVSIERGESLSFISEPLGGIFIPPPNLSGLRSFNLALGEPLRLEIRMTNSIPELTLFGAPGLRYEVQFRAGFEVQWPWQSLTNLVLSNNPTIIADSTATGVATRFYQAVRSP